MARRPRSSSMITNIVFDLDGTLIDSLPGIGQAIRASWAEVFPGRDLPDLRPLMGPPIARILLSIDPSLCAEHLQRLVSHFRHFYDSQYCLNATLFPGCAKTLRQLLNEGKNLYIVTNKPTKPTALLAEHLQFGPYFKAMLSLDSAIPAFRNKAAILKNLLTRHHLKTASTVMVGDAQEDATSAAECGLGFISACYGYGRISTAQFKHGLFDLDQISDLPNRLPAL